MINCERADYGASSHARAQSILLKVCLIGCIWDGGQTVFFFRGPIIACSTPACFGEVKCEDMLRPKAQDTINNTITAFIFKASSSSLASF